MVQGSQARPPAPHASHRLPLALPIMALIVLAALLLSGCGGSSSAASRETETYQKATRDYAQANAATHPGEADFGAPIRDLEGIGSYRDSAAKASDYRVAAATWWAEETVQRAKPAGQDPAADLQPTEEALAKTREFGLGTVHYRRALRATQQAKANRSYLENLPASSTDQAPGTR